MYGAILGDIIGSPYEWHPAYTKDFPLFRRRSHFTDDTVMTIAVVVEGFFPERRGRSGTSQKSRYGHS